MLGKGECVMAIHVELPRKTEDELRSLWGDLPQAALESLLIESYRTRKISVGYLAKVLGMGVIEADAWLKTRGIPLNYTVEDLQADSETLDRLFGGIK